MYNIINILCYITTSHGIGHLKISHHSLSHNVHSLHSYAKEYRSKFSSTSSLVVNQYKNRKRKFQKEEFANRETKYPPSAPPPATTNVALPTDPASYTTNHTNNVPSVHEQVNEDGYNMYYIKH